MSSDMGAGPRIERLPRNYSTILTTIHAAAEGTHLTAQEVFERARRAQPRIGFATVHRALARLYELGYVNKVDVPGATSAVYERTAEPHAHFRCTGCGTIEDVAFVLPADVLTTLGERYGLQIAAESTTFAGRCARCAAHEPEAFNAVR
jgi:Fur family ferric uptake transcriptional regulator